MKPFSIKSIHISPFKTNQNTAVYLRLRLFILLLILFLLTGFSIFFVFTVNGYFHLFPTHYQDTIGDELKYVSKNVTLDYQKIANYAVELSKTTSENIEDFLHHQNISSQDIKDNPNTLTKLIMNQYEDLLFALQRCESCGVFLILDASVNPSLHTSNQSKSGIYIRKTKSNPINSIDSNISLLKGSSQISQLYAVPLDSEWTMEFDVTNAPYFTIPLEQAYLKTVSLSNLYYWSSASLPGNHNKVMLCSIPLTDSKGSVLGICGFELSELCFKDINQPDNSDYDNIITVFAPNAGHTLLSSDGFFAGSSVTKQMNTNNIQIKSHSSIDNIKTYQQADGNTFYGTQIEIDLYPDDSPYSNQKWVTAVLIPQKDIQPKIAAAYFKLFMILLIMTIIGVVLSYFSSKKYLTLLLKKTSNINPINPENEELNVTKSESPCLANASQTKSQDIPVTLPDSSMFQDFVNNINILSPAERTVFNLYLEGYTPKEITEILSLSINTIKTHNKRIYTKLNVSSRNELLLYVHMLKNADPNGDKNEDNKGDAKL